MMRTPITVFLLICSFSLPISLIPTLGVEECQENFPPIKSLKRVERSCEDMRGSKPLKLHRYYSAPPMFSAVQPLKSSYISLLSIDELCRILSHLDPLERAQIRGVCRIFRYAINKMEHEGPLRGQITFESQRKFCSILAVFAEADWGNFPISIEYCDSTTSENEFQTLFKEKLDPKDGVIQLAQGKRKFEILPGVALTFEYWETYVREGFYTCRKLPGYIRMRREVCQFQEPLSQANESFHLIQLTFSMTPEGIACHGKVL